MTRMRFERVAALAMVALCMGVINASAQITTGTVAGTVKDAQGGVVPGATVVLISETKGTEVRAGRHQRDGRLRVSERHGRTPTRSKSRWKGSRPSSATASRSAAATAWRSRR